MLSAVVALRRNHSAVREGFLEEVALMDGKESQQLPRGREWELGLGQSPGRAAGRPRSMMGPRGETRSPRPG